MSSTDQAALNGAGIEVHRALGRRWSRTFPPPSTTSSTPRRSSSRPPRNRFSPTRRALVGSPTDDRFTWNRDTCAQHLVVSSNCWSASPPDSSRSIAAPLDSEGTLALTRLTLAASPDAKPVHDVRRVMRVQGDTLTYDLWMAHGDTPLTHHLHATLHRATDR